MIIKSVDLQANINVCEKKTMNSIARNEKFFIGFIILETQHIYLYCLLFIIKFAVLADFSICHNVVSGLRDCFEIKHLRANTPVFLFIYLQQNIAFPAD